MLCVNYTSVDGLTSNVTCFNTDRSIRHCSANRFDIYLIEYFELGSSYLFCTKSEIKLLIRYYTKNNIFETRALNGKKN